MSFTLTTRGTRWVATCDDCQSEIAAGPSKVGTAERGEKHTCPDSGIILGKRPSAYLLRDAMDAYDDTHTEPVKVRATPPLWSCDCVHCGETLAAVTEDRVRTRAAYHYRIRHDESPLQVSSELAAILLGHAPVRPVNPPF